MKEWRLSIHQGVVLIEFDPGTVLNPAMMRVITGKMNAEPEKFRTTNVVWDIRNILPDHDSGFDEMFRVVDYIRASWESWWTQTKTALVVGSKETLGLGRMFAALAEQSLDYEVQIFDNDLEGAINWAQPSG